MLNETTRILGYELFFLFVTFCIIGMSKNKLLNLEYKMKFVKCVVCLGLIMFFMQPLLADNMANNKYKQQDGIKYFEKLSIDLNLTDDQKTKIQSLQKEQKETVPVTMRELKQKNKDLDMELAKEKYDNAVVNKLAQEIISLENKLSSNRLNTKIKMRSILSAEQFKQLDKNMRNVHQKGLNTQPKN